MYRIAAVALLLAGCGNGDPVGFEFKDPAANAAIECGRIIVERDAVRRGEPTLDTIPCRYLEQP